MLHSLLHRDWAGGCDRSEMAGSGQHTLKVLVHTRNEGKHWQVKSNTSREEGMLASPHGLKVWADTGNQHTVRSASTCMHLLAHKIITTHVGAHRRTKGPVTWALSPGPKAIYRRKCVPGVLAHDLMLRSSVRWRNLIADSQALTLHSNKQILYNQLSSWHPKRK